MWTRLGVSVLLFATLFTPPTGSTCHITKDDLTGPLFIDSYERNGGLLDTIVANYSVSTQGKVSEHHQCVPHFDQFRVGEITARLRRETHLILTVLCPSRLEIQALEGLTGIPLDNRIVFSHVMITNCNVSTHFLESMANYFNIYGLILIDTNLYTQRNIRQRVLQYVHLSFGQLTVRSESVKLSILDLPLNGVKYNSTVILGLIGMGFTELPDNFTSHFPNLQTLALSSNGLRSPPLVSFPNRITLLPNNVTRTNRMRDDTEYVWELNTPLNAVPRVLDLRDNQIRSIQKNDVHGFIDLLYLSRNQIVWISDGAFRQISALKSLHLDRNRIKIITRGMFSGLQSLNSLQLSHNGLREIQNNAFVDLSNLHFLDLENNSLHKITRQQLYGLRKLKFLALRNNKLSELDKGVFLSIPSLTDINLSSNPLSEIPQGMLTMLSLNSVDLSKTGLHLENFIDAIKKLPTRYLTGKLLDGHLPTIALRDNGITSVYNITWNCLMYLELPFRINVVLGLQAFCLDVSGNLLSCDCDLAELLSNFNFAQNNLIDSGVSQLSWELCWEGWTCQTPLEFYGKSIFDLKPDRLYCPLISDHDLCPKRCNCFQRYKHEGKVIDCDDRELTELPMKQPEGLLDIRLKKNSIRKFPTRSYLGRIERLYLSYNSISEFPFSIVSIMVNLTHLHLDHNNLTDFPVLGNLTNLKEIRLDHNLYKCNCANLWFKTWLIQNKDKVINWENVSCSTEAGLVEPVISLTDFDLGCSVIINNMIYIALPLSFVSLFIVVVFVLVVYFHQDLRVLWFIYHSKNYISSQKYIANRKFVTAVIFAEDDRGWVVNNIIKPLELRFPDWPYVMRFESFVAGRTMKANIEHLLRVSVTITVLLSPALLSDEWCMYVLEESVTLAVKNKINFVNLIKVPNCPVQRMTSGLVHNYIRLKRYLDPKSKLFKEKLLFSIFGGKVGKMTGPAGFSQRSASLHSIGTMSITHNSNDEVTMLNDNATQFQFDVGIIYGDRDRHLVIRGLLPVLERQVQKVCLPDRDDIYIPGDPDKNNILRLITASRIIILVASREFVFTERCLFTFRAATGGVLSREQNFILLFSEDVDSSAIRDLEAYRKSHVCLYKTDEQFIEKLKQSLCPSM